MSTEVTRLKDRLFGVDGLQPSAIRFYPGEESGQSPEEVAAEMNAVLGRLEVGDYENVDDYDD